MSHFSSTTDVTTLRRSISVRAGRGANNEGDASFLTGPTERTREVWEHVSAMFPEERRRGISDVDAATPSSITSHAPGYVLRDRELIVGLQTDAPLKRAIMPNGGLRMVEKGLAAYGYELDTAVRTVFTEYRKTHNDGVFDAYTPEMPRARRSHIITSKPKCRTSSPGSCWRHEAGAAGTERLRFEAMGN
ncbi:hypothetical protein GCM10029978_075380 [Actinoallomurus acanthiterrae]